MITETAQCSIALLILIYRGKEADKHCVSSKISKETKYLDTHGASNRGKNPKRA